MRYDVVLLHSMWRFSYSLRMRKNRKTRYGLLSTHDDGLEMRHLDEDEEDATVFDRALAHSRRWPTPSNFHSHFHKGRCWRALMRFNWT